LIFERDEEEVLEEEVLVSSSSGTMISNNRRDGYGLTISYNDSSKSPLVELGILEDLTRHDVLSRSHYVFKVSYIYHVEKEFNTRL